VRGCGRSHLRRPEADLKAAPLHRLTDTRNVLYHYLQHDLHDEDAEMFRILSGRLVLRLGIWLSPDVYRRLPLLVPYARRDPTSRGNRATGAPDQWGSPDPQGYFRDDNSLVKGVPRSMRIASSFPLYRSRRMGTGFVAAHVWRSINAPESGARNPLTYSFVPNLVWLPVQVAGLSDLEGSFVQRLLQRAAIALYRDVEVARSHRELISSIWQLLPEPDFDAGVLVPDVAALSTFVPDETFFQRRAALITRVARGLTTGLPTGKIISTRYTSGIPLVEEDARLRLGEFLEQYGQGIMA
jgi:hypothetical protein